VSRKIVLGAVAAAGAAVFVFLIVVMAGQGLEKAGLWAGPLAALAGIVAAVAAVWAVVPARRELALPPDLQVPGWVVDRPAELAEVVRALVHAEAGTVGITTGLYGAGGFGKTTLARMVCADRRVRRWFGSRVYLVTVGRDVRGSDDIALKVNDVIKLMTGEDASFTDPQLAGLHLGSVLDTGPRRLLVLDDVWESEQLAPFTLGGRKCARLVTTRVPELLAGHGPAVRVDQMSEAQARVVLTDGLPPLDEVVVAGLLAVTGRWPLLLRLVNKILADYVQVAAEVETPGAVLLERLAAGGPAVVDEVLGENGRALDVGQPGQRERAVRATIEASTGLLSRDDAERLAELGVFAEDEAVPFGLVVQLWRATAGLDELQAAQVCRRLAQLALISQAPAPGGGIALHDVIRDFLRRELGQPRLTGLNGVLLDAAAAGLPAAVALDSDEYSARVAWWELGEQDRYLWDHLIEHLREAQRIDEAEAVACDLRWVGARLERSGPAAPVADLALAGTPRAFRLRAMLVRTAHLLAPTEPTRSVVDVLYSRVAEDPDWGQQVADLADSCRRPRLVNRWPLPDLADPALRRVLAGHTHDVDAVAVAPDGSWLASAGGDDNTVRIWDAVTGEQRAVLTGHTDSVNAVAVAPDGSWLASAGYDKKVRIWDAATGQQRAVLTGHTDSLDAVAVAPDGSWLASGGRDGTVRIWDAATGRQRALLTGHTGMVSAVAVAPDGNWLASVDRYGLDPGGRNGTVRIWDVATGRQRAVLTGHTGPVRAVAVAPDGSWLASGGDDGTVRIWDAATGQQRAVPTGHGWVWTVAIAPDGSWLASGGRDRTVRIWDAANARDRTVQTGHAGWVSAVAVAPDGTWLASADRDDGRVRIWDAATGQQRAVLTGHAGLVSALVVAPDGSWLASTDWKDGTVRIWDAVAGQQRAVLTGHTGSKGHVAVTAVAVAPDGSWLASAGRDDKKVRIWDAATGQQRAVLTGHTAWVTAVAVAPDGSWLASSGYDGTVRIWDAATGRKRAVLTGHSKVEAVAVAPDGSWLASAGRGDGTVRIWDATTGLQRAALTGHSAWVHAVAVAPDGNWLASAADDGTVRIWDTVTWHTLATMRIDGIASDCAWLGSDALVVGGSAGLYLFGFLTETRSAAVTTSLRPLPRPATGNDVAPGE
jgi:WD40 repeat protein